MRAIFDRQRACRAGRLAAVSGTGQVISRNDVPSPVILRVVDAAGHPMAGATVSFYESLKEWGPPCPASGRCPSVPVLMTQSAQAVSDADGIVTLNPLYRPGVATRLALLAFTGEAGTLLVEIEQQP